MKTPDDILKAHKKNMDTMTSINQLASDVMQSVVTMQSEYLQQVFKDMQEVIKLPNSPAETQEKISNIASNSISHGTKILSAATKAQQDAANLLQDHMSECYSKNKH